MRVTGRQVVDFVAERHGLTFQQMIGQQRVTSVARPRQIAMYVMREVCPHLSLPTIGRILGGRDHTTILHGVQRIEALIHTHEDVLREVLAALRHFDNEALSTDILLEARIDAATKHLNALLHERKLAEVRAMKVAA
ncbi:helix-turn-helix domain-containing protein [Brevundimonas diminuta]|uniref:helix-turn-helix domain-containing protein n=1 Tax=Brevundimonas diminuta TaxID=293 RepID=UPI0025A577DC|nr:helix-turn-helix domain-containing protein [Brevundimonas diminuta]MDM8352882.1 helix-turn-helix domain-containing protein [Brevundimonas diminuta]